MVKGHASECMAVVTPLFAILEQKKICCQEVFWSYLGLSGNSPGYFFQSTTHPLSNLIQKKTLGRESFMFHGMFHGNLCGAPQGTVQV